MATSPRPRRVAASALHGSLVLIAEGYGSAREKADREIASLEAGPSPGYVDALVSISSLARKVLPGDRRAFAGASRELLPPLAALLETAASSLLQAAAGGRENDDEALEATGGAVQDREPARARGGPVDGARRRRGLLRRLPAARRPRLRGQRHRRTSGGGGSSSASSSFQRAVGATRRRSRFAAPFLERAVDALERTPLHDRLTAAGAVARLDLCGRRPWAAPGVADACGGASSPRAARGSRAGASRAACWRCPCTSSRSGRTTPRSTRSARQADGADARAAGADGDDDGGFDRGDVDDGGDEPGARATARGACAPRRSGCCWACWTRRGGARSRPASAAVLDGAVGTQAAEALLGAVDRVSSSPDALRRLGKEELAHFRGFFARAEAGLRAARRWRGFKDALPDDAPQRVRRWIGGALPRLLRGLRNAALAPPVALHVNFSASVVLAAVRRRLYWFARCWAFSLYDAPELIALVCGEASADAAEGDAAVALGLWRRSGASAAAAFSAESAALPALAAAVGRARTFALPDHVEALYAEATADVPAPPSLLGALADAARVGVVARARGGARRRRRRRALAALVSALCDAARDPELCCAGPGLRLWLELVRSFDGQAPVPASLAPRSRLRAALRRRRRATSRSPSTSARSSRPTACSGPSGSRGRVWTPSRGRWRRWRARSTGARTGTSTSASSASLAWCPAVALAALGRDDFKAIKLLARDALEARVPDAVRAQHLAVLARCLCRDAARRRRRAGRGPGAGHSARFLDRAHVRGDALSVDDVARAAPGDGVASHRAR
ncbi:Ran GTPase binding protein [Aureococcus anophagefferens]|uniref:Ran GTPase binding protein n=1 Tax=Aureococcus anophagefferens TaxID=44056 RepID=A0ABR1FM31_AURAN